MNSVTAIDYQPAAAAFGAAGRILLVSHEYTDGDDLGAMLALKFALEALGKKPVACSRGGAPDNLMFLPGVQDVLDQLPPENFDIVALLGCSDAGRTGFVGSPAGKVINIDHHHDNKRFGEINLVDPEASATCEVIYHLIKALAVEITKPVAINLLTGIFNDTGGFRHANTSAAVLEIAAELMRRGARIDRISEYYFGKSELPKLRAWAKALENARFDPEQKMVYSVVTEEELAEVGAGSEDLEGVVSILNTVPEANYSMLLKQRGDEIKGSLRSENYKGVDVSAIARNLGGGGHKLAAGFKLKGKIEKTKDGWKIT